MHQEKNVQIVKSIPVNWGHINDALASIYLFINLFIFWGLFLCPLMLNDGIRINIVGQFNYKYSKYLYIYIRSMRMIGLVYLQLTVNLIVTVNLIDAK